MNGERGVVSHSGHRARGRFHKVFGFLLSAIGFLWLAKKAGWMPADHGHAAIFLPMIVIAAGLFLVFSNGRKRNRQEG